MSYRYLEVNRVNHGDDPSTANRCVIKISEIIMVTNMGNLTLLELTTGRTVLLTDSYDDFVRRLSEIDHVPSNFD